MLEKSLPPAPALQWMPYSLRTALAIGSAAISHKALLLLHGKLLRILRHDESYLGQFVGVGVGFGGSRGGASPT